MKNMDSFMKGFTKGLTQGTRCLQGRGTKMKKYGTTEHCPKCGEVRYDILEDKFAVEYCYGKMVITCSRCKFVFEELPIDAADDIKVSVNVMSTAGEPNDVKLVTIPSDERIANFIWDKMNHHDFLFENCPDRLERPGELIDDMVSIARDVRKFINGY